MEVQKNFNQSNHFYISFDDLITFNSNTSCFVFQVLFAMHSSGLVDILLFIASNRGEQSYHLQILEVKLRLC